MHRLRTRLFQIWFRLSRPMTLGVRAIVENEHGQILLVRHSYTPGLYLPGGGVEQGEPARQALERELIEEAGIQLTGAAELCGIFSNHAIFRNDHVLVYHIRANAWASCAATQSGEISEILWCDPLAPNPDITPGNRRRLAERYNGQPISAFW